MVRNHFGSIGLLLKSNSQLPPSTPLELESRLGGPDMKWWSPRREEMSRRPIDLRYSTIKRHKGTSEGTDNALNAL